MIKPTWADQLLIDEKTAYGQRLALIKPEHTIRGMLLSSIFDCLKKEMGSTVANNALKDSGLTAASFSPMKKIPLVDFERARLVIATRLEGKLGSFEAASCRMGAYCLESFFDSVTGKTMMLLSGKDPHRLMGAAPNGYSLAIDDGGSRRYTKTGERSGEFTFENDMLGVCHEVGTFTAAIKIVCGIDIVVKIEQHSLTDFNVNIKW